MKTYLTPKQVAEILGVSPPTVYMWMDRNSDPAWMHERIPEPTAQVCWDSRSAPSVMWDESQIPEWKEWYATYQENKRKNRKGD